ncbi:MAG: GNAT family N-acetyltransferase [Desulforhopalus sp.]
MSRNNRFFPLYPFKYNKDISLKNGTTICVRSVRGEDEPGLKQFFETLSAESFFLRFSSPHISLDHDHLARLCQVDYDRNIAFLAVVPGEEESIIGDVRLTRLNDLDCAELSVVIADQWQGMGAGSHLMNFCLILARKMGLTNVLMEIMKSNIRMKRMGCKYGFLQLPCNKEDYMQVMELKIRPEEKFSIPFAGREFFSNTPIDNRTAAMQ